MSARHTRNALTAAIVLMLFACRAAAGVLDCLPTRAIQVRVQIEGRPADPPLLLTGDVLPSLQLRDAAGALVWSAGPRAPASQILPAFNAGFTGSITPLDTDGDGLHDRLYAGDLGGRLWRFDIHNGAPPNRLLSGAPFAELAGASAARAFVAPPDISLTAGPGGARWLTIAIGSVRLDGRGNDNRFYLLRDHAPLHAWSDIDYARLRPLREEDLVRLPIHSPPAISATAEAPFSGFYLPVAGSVMAGSITVAGRLSFASALDLPDRSSGCATDVAIGGLTLEAGAPAVEPPPEGDASGHAPWLMTGRAPAGATFRLESSGDGRTQLSCRFGSIEIPACALTRRWQRNWWLREDAD